MTNRDLVEMIIEAIITTSGKERWEAMTAEEQSDAIMQIVRDFDKALDNFNKR